MRIVILPGLDGTGQLLRDLQEQLSKSHDVSVAQYPSEMHRYEDLVGHLSSWLPEEDYIIVAESFAGPLAVKIASAHPKGLQSIAFVATFAKRPRNIPIWFAHILHLLPLRSKYFVRLAQPIVMGPWANEAFTRDFASVLKDAVPSTLIGRLRAVHTVDVTTSLADLTIPSIYLRATRDMIVPARAASDFSRRVVEHSQIDGPHFLLQAEPAQTAKQILDFAARFA